MGQLIPRPLVGAENCGCCIMPKTKLPQKKVKIAPMQDDSSGLKEDLSDEDLSDETLRKSPGGDS